MYQFPMQAKCNGLWSNVGDPTDPATGEVAIIPAKKGTKVATSSVAKYLTLATGGRSFACLPRRGEPGPRGYRGILGDKKGDLPKEALVSKDA